MLRPCQTNGEQLRLSRTGLVVKILLYGMILDQELHLKNCTYWLFEMAFSPPHQRQRLISPPFSSDLSNQPETNTSKIMYSIPCIIEETARLL